MSEPYGPYQTYDGGALYTRCCPTCGRIVEADESILINGLDEVVDEGANATCRKCGRVQMEFLGWFEEARATINATEEA